MSCEICWRVSEPVAVVEEVEEDGDEAEAAEGEVAELPAVEVEERAASGEEEEREVRADGRAAVSTGEPTIGTAVELDVLTDVLLMLAVLGCC